ncbi:AzlD domain-containing protein [Kiloniella laminariae]|uniref:AzlD domain-containing protein n=1 Tax=Kiloniella laminariae TaxID=454162 RepID=A0ABT4LKR6_9PROT|nr:AzlD domain-containing protein [Kiloniella laminariae]MCZ4281550.1 AzlD domain-containing protein [Kiloniella laminariae]
MTEILMITGMAAVTFAIRYILLASAGHFSFPGWAKAGLNFVPPAVLTAIIFPAILIPNNNGIEFNIENPALLAAIVAVITGLVRKDLLTTIIVGMFAFGLFKWLL